MTECPAHPGVEAVGTCTRCGRFYCAAEARVLDGQLYCGACAERPEVDWLGRHYAKLEGKRSGLVWFAAFLGSLGLLSGGAGFFALFELFRGLSAGESLGDVRWVLGPAGMVLWSVSALLLLSGWRWTRWLHLGALVVASAMLGLSNLDDTAKVFTGIGALCMGGLFFAALANDVRTRLFFRLPVARGALKQHYERYGSNWQAASASRLAALSLFIPGLALISLGLAVWGLSRIDKQAVPPVGGLGSAIGALVLSALSCALWGTLFSPLVR